jgi:alpha-D-xyloside xylohydrolase
MPTSLYMKTRAGYEYEHGTRSLIPLHWDDGKHILTIGDRQGSFPAMIETRDFRVLVVREGYGIGIDPVEKTTASIKFIGHSIQVRMPPG